MENEMGYTWNALGRREILALFWQPAGQMLLVNLLKPDGIILKIHIDVLLIAWLVVGKAMQERNHSVQKSQHFLRFLCLVWDSWVGIATNYGLDGPGIESRWEAKLSAPVQTGPGVHPTSCVFPGRIGAWGVSLITHLHLQPKLKKEYSYNSTLPLGLSGRL